MRWLFHVLHARDVSSWGGAGRYAPSSLAREGFIHASYKDAVRASARLYFEPGAELRVLAVDPRRLDVPIDVASTPRGPMPHIHGAIPFDAIRVLDFDELDEHPEQVSGTRFGLLAWSGMTLLDMVGPLDALGRIPAMGIDPTATVEVVALTRPPTNDRGHDVPVWSGAGLSLSSARYRPPLDDFDVLVVPGGPDTKTLLSDPELLSYLHGYPEHRVIASVCTGALVLGALGRLRGRRASTHASAREALAAYGAKVVPDRVVDEGQLITSGGVTSGIDLGIHLVRRFYGDAAAHAVAERMEVR